MDQLTPQQRHKTMAATVNGKIRSQRLLCARDSGAESSDTGLTTNDCQDTLTWY